MDGAIEAALQPGRFIGWNEGFSFVSDLDRIQEEIGRLVRSDAARAVALYETFIAGCTEKAEEIDDSDGELGTFAGGLYCGWIQARQACGADRDETARLLLAFMDDDPYGFCNDLERRAVKVLDKAGLEAFERQAHARFDAALGERKAGAERDYLCQHWGQILRSVYAAQRNIQKYLDLTDRTELTQADCETIATLFQQKRKLNDALVWVERGLKVERRNVFEGGSGHKLAEMRRALLAKLGRGEDALDSAWAEFQAHPNKFTYAELFRYVPRAKRKAWHEKAMAAAEQGNLASLIELWLSAKEIDRLAERLNRAADTELEGLSHYATEPAAERLARTHPGVAARVFRAMAMRIVDAGKSKYYYAALSNFERAKSCYQTAGLNTQWEAVVAQVRRVHHRKTGIMPGFERIVAGKGSATEPSFLDRARARWAQRGKA